MQIDLQVTEARAKELAVLFNQSTPGSSIPLSIPPGTTVEIVKPVVGMMGADSGKWTVRLTTTIATAAQIATLVTFALAHAPAPQPDPPASQTKQAQCEVTLTRGQTKMQAQFSCSQDSPELVKGITDFMAKNGQPDKVHVKLVPPHHAKKP
jgi:hypothetical protein